jgi:UDP-glucose 4-epimerase
MSRLGKPMLVTGGAGFIGSELVRQLAALATPVVVVDNLCNGRRANLAGLPREQVQLHVVDIRARDTVRRLLRGVDTVFHLACLGVRHSIHAPAENHEINARGTLDVLLAARRAGVRRFVHVSTSEVYGTAQQVPMSEAHPTFPRTVYGASKLAGECYVRAFHRTYGFPTVVVRPFNAYGPRCHHEGDCGEVIPKFLLRCMAGRPLVIFGDGGQTRDFTFVADTARGILAAGLTEAAVGRTLNLGSGRETSLNELVQVIAGVVGCTPEVVYEAPRPGDVRRLCADAGKVRDLLGYAAHTDLRKGLVQLKAWYESLDEPPEHLLQQDIVHNWECSGRALPRPTSSGRAPVRPTNAVAFDLVETQ